MHPLAEMFANRLRKNLRRLQPWARQRGVALYRLYDRDIPEVGLAVDRYQDRLHVAEYHKAAFTYGPDGEELTDDREGRSGPAVVDREGPAVGARGAPLSDSEITPAAAPPSLPPRAFGRHDDS